jgi:hypothetical protein
MFCIFAQWTTPWRYDPRREDQGKQCWSFVSFVFMLFTPYTCTHTQKVKLLIKEFVMKCILSLWICEQLFVVYWYNVYHVHHDLSQLWFWTQVVAHLWQTASVSAKRFRPWFFSQWFWCFAAMLWYVPIMSLYYPHLRWLVLYHHQSCVFPQLMV